MYKVTAHKLNSFRMRQLRQILKWWQFVSNEKILKAMTPPSMYKILISRFLRRAGHASRLDNTRLPKLILYSQLTDDGTRGAGHLKLRYKNTIKRNLKYRNIPLESWQNLSRSRDGRRQKIRRRKTSSSAMMDS